MRPRHRCACHARAGPHLRTRVRRSLLERRTTLDAPAGGGSQRCPPSAQTRRPLRRRDGWPQQHRGDHCRVKRGARPPRARRTSAQPMVLSKLEAAGFSVEDIRIIPRPTALPTSIEPWLDTFGEAFFGALLEPDRPAARAEVANLLRPVLVDETGTWIADYVRLRFRATRSV